jgi:hypothetical protein
MSKKRTAPVRHPATGRFLPKDKGVVGTIARLSINRPMAAGNQIFRSTSRGS